jgi:hypothetical protein
MLSEEFLNCKYSYRVRREDMAEFLSECDEHGLSWLRGGKASSFDPFAFYSGENMRFLLPVMQIDSTEDIYIRCLAHNLDFSFQYNWFMQPSRDYKTGDVINNG